MSRKTEKFILRVVSTLGRIPRVYESISKADFKIYMIEEESGRQSSIKRY
jgi:hypothetical protein